MTNKIIIRQATLDDESLIANFFKKGFGKKKAVFKYPYRWAWIYKNNPFLHNDRLLPIWLAVDGNHIVGMACNMLLDFEVGQQVVKAGWGIDFRVLPEYRGMGLGYRLEKIKQ
ncbi:MAG: GNAT family N-acetyltransferase, partial [Candidatus Aenigmarchaeota archaeon]|nr:GNAT family N-acetyltransferase [Candidatus Aenigmarchaeota archaeon]